MRRSIALVLAGAAALALPPAHGGAAAGTCTGSVRFNFANPITNNSGPTNYTMTGSGSCQTSAQAAAFKTMQFGSSSGTATTARCGALTLQGPYTVDFQPDPAPTGGNGQANFVGTASGGVWVWLGSSPTLVGVGILAGTGAVACASGGTSSLTFTMSFTFVDP